MGDELILIECANLASSEQIRRPSDDTEKDVDESSLIADAVLAKSEANIKETTSMNGDATKCQNSDDTSDIGVFEDADDDKTAAWVLGPVKVLPNTGTEEHHRIKLTEDILIAYAHLSDNELNVSERGHAHDEADKAKDGVEEDYLSIPRLDIGHISDDHSVESDKDGYKTPVNSEQGEAPRRKETPDKNPKSEQPRERSPEFRIAFDGAMGTDCSFDTLVIDTANAIDAFEFEDIKSLFRCVEGFEIFTDQDSPILFLNHMRRYKMISPDNLQHLQTILARLGNPLLQMRARHYTKQKDQTVYFYPETRHVPLGFGTFKCHISGKDFTRLKRNDLEIIRTVLSQLLFIPTSSIYTIGIEPGINLVVSMMIPTRYIGTLKKMATGGLPELGHIGVDLVQISGRTFKTQGLKAHVLTGNEHMKFLTVYQQLREKNLQLEERDKEISALKADAEFIRLELETKNAELNMLEEKSPLYPFRRHRSAERSRQPVRRQRSMPATRMPMTRIDKARLVATGPRQAPDIKIVVSEADTERQSDERVTGGETVLEKQSNTTEDTLASLGSRERHGQMYTDHLGFEWTRGDIAALSNARHIIERDEIMSEIESIISELGFPSDGQTIDRL